MRVLLIKTSSMGDLVHTLPALHDAGEAIPGIRFDWVVEDVFAEIPALHPLVDKVIPVALRRWRKGLMAAKTNQEWQTLKKELKHEKYDLILDAQGLVKSAFLMFFTRGKTAGLDWSSARESLASLVYQAKYTVNFHQHAIVRMRSLFSQAFSYPLPDSQPTFGLDRAHFITKTNAFHQNRQPYLVFLHGTTWRTKMWPEHYWAELARYAHAAGLRVKITGGNEEEMERAKRIARANKTFEMDVISRLSILDMASLLANACGVVAVDTGFGHLAAALDVPTVSLYGATNKIYTGAIGLSSIQLSALHPCAPCLKRYCRYKGPAIVFPACFASLPPRSVWNALQKII